MPDGSKLHEFLCTFYFKNEQCLVFGYINVKAKVWKIQYTHTYTPTHTHYHTYTQKHHHTQSYCWLYYSTYFFFSKQRCIQKQVPSLNEICFLIFGIDLILYRQTHVLLSFRDFKRLVISNFVYILQIYPCTSRYPQQSRYKHVSLS